MDNNSIIGLVVIALILVVYGIINKPSQQEIERAKRTKDSLQRVQQEQIDTPSQKEQQQAAATEQQAEKQAQPDTSATEELEKVYGSFGRSAQGEQKFIIL